MKLAPLFVLVGVVVGCADPASDPDAPAFGQEAPRVQIVSPARGTIAGDVPRVLVTGTASDDSGVIGSVTVNGVTATVAEDGTWRVDVPVAPGTTLLRAIVRDLRGNQGEDTRAVVAGPMAALDRYVPTGIVSTLSADAVGTLGRGAATFIESGGLMTAVQGMNPVVAVGGGPDCFYAQATITSLTVGAADVAMAPTPGGITLATALDDVRVGVHLQWAASCVEGTRDVVMSAQRVTVQGVLAIDVADHTLDVQLDDPNVQVTGFEVQLSDVPDSITQLLELDAAIGPVLGLMTERLVAPMVERSLMPLAATKTLDVAGIKLDVVVEPATVSFTAQGGTVALDTSLRAQHDTGWFVFAPNRGPALDMKHGFELALADDAANQLLTSMWSARAFDSTIDLHVDAYAQIGKYYDSVELQLAVPPHVDASGHPLELTIGDWIATFKRGGVIAATVAIHARSALYVVGSDGALRMEVSTPTAGIDVVGDGDSLTKGQYAAIQSFAVDHITTVASAAVGAIPLPVVGVAMPTNLWVEPEAGSLLVFGDVQLGGL